MSQSDEIIQLQKDVRSLSKKLERSEKNRTLLEQMWDRNSRLFQTLNTEIEQQRELIQRQHRELELERQKSENLLLNILPHSIAQRLKEDQPGGRRGVGEAVQSAPEGRRKCKHGHEHGYGYTGLPQEGNAMLKTVSPVDEKIAEDHHFDRLQPPGLTGDSGAESGRHHAIKPATASD